MELRYTKQANNALRVMDEARVAKIDATLRAIAAAPFARHTGVEPITGAKDVFRRRFGQLRAVYEIDRKAQTMTVTAITTRGKAYKK